MDIFVTGASGYIGGSVAERLKAAGHHIIGLVRSDAKAEQLRARGMEAVVGTLDDARLLAEQAKRADAVVNAANSDHRTAVEMLIRSLAGSNKPFLHTSGSSIAANDARGEPDERIYRRLEEVTPEPEKAARVRVDQRVREAADVGVRSVVLCNTLIYGHGLGLQRDSVQIPALVRQAQRSGIARHVGRGLNRWANVHVEDMADLYLLALEQAKPGSFYFVENGEASFQELVQAIADALGLGEAQSWPAEEAIAEWGFEKAMFALASNSRVRSDLARTELGWQPRHDSVVDWVRRELRQG
ncbi:MAG TPA: NAD-dependent epimerase/dehydratase family protein [Geminicoccus sp.]|uniref:NAD-dependent epimerase/dehydratase family protein n=1 Tax=Geminicoccus sp. TaxID=2024832 RepID=UPI002B7B902F|nr:NAD-dependent epimerase/dehydratase family protein [Geminicoccus sp.]HWL71802.1 NAD-dependent epimerase/dehydratase family protein [Geminicoccus sp.]